MKKYSFIIFLVILIIFCSCGKGNAKMPETLISHAANSGEKGQVEYHLNSKTDYSFIIKDGEYMYSCVNSTIIKFHEGSTKAEIVYTVKDGMTINKMNFINENKIYFTLYSLDELDYEGAFLLNPETAELIDLNESNHSGYYSHHVLINNQIYYIYLDDSPDVFSEEGCELITETDGIRQTVIKGLIRHEYYNGRFYYTYINDEKNIYSCDPDGNDEQLEIVSDEDIMRYRILKNSIYIEKKHSGDVLLIYNIDSKEINEFKTSHIYAEGIHDGVYDGGDHLYDSDYINGDLIKININNNSYERIKLQDISNGEIQFENGRMYVLSNDLYDRKLYYVDQENWNSIEIDIFEQ